MRKITSVENRLLIFENLFHTGGDCCPSTNQKNNNDQNKFNWVCENEDSADYNLRVCNMKTSGKKGDGTCDGDTDLNTHVCDWDGMTYQYHSRLHSNLICHVFLLTILRW